MKASTLNELKKELGNLGSKELIDLCIRLAKYKKDSKELLTYLLFEADNEQAYIEGVKADINLGFEEINRSNLYLVKKGLRKILRNTNKHIRYSGNKQTETELLIYFCSTLNASGINISKSTQLINLYDQQLKKINKAFSSLHEDLQFDYRQALNELIRKSPSSSVNLIL